MVSVRCVVVAAARVERRGLVVLVRTRVPAVHRVPIEREADDGRMVSGVVVRGVQAGAAERVPMVVVVLALAGVSVALVHLATRPTVDPSVVVVREHRDAVDGHRHRASCRQAGHIRERVLALLTCRIAVLDGIDIINTGVGYEVGDTITTEDGQILEPVIQNGRIVDAIPVDVIDGISSLPKLKINTTNGFGAIIRPTLDFIKVKQYEKPILPSTKVIQVIDCVTSY